MMEGIFYFHKSKNCCVKMNVMLMIIKIDFIQSIIINLKIKLEERSMKKMQIPHHNGIDKIDENTPRKTMWKIVLLSGLCTLFAQTSSEAMQVLNLAKQGRTCTRLEPRHSAHRNYSSNVNPSAVDPSLEKLKAIFPHNKDSFGTFYPHSPKLVSKEPNEITTIMTSFTKHVKVHFPKKAVIVELLPDDFGLTKYFEEAGFEVHSSTMKKKELLFKNDSPIPPTATTLNVARLILMVKGDILVVEDKNHPGALMFPGGYVDARELPVNAASRECMEEVGIKTIPKKLEIVGIMDRVNANKYGASLTNRYYYKLAKSRKTFKKQEEELIGVKWCRLSDLVKNNGADGLVPSPVTLEVLKYIHKKSKKQKELPFPDLRQQKKAESDRDPNDVMSLHLLPVTYYKSKKKEKISQVRNQDLVKKQRFE